MSDSDGSHSYPKMPHKLSQNNFEDPGSRYLRHATHDVNGLRRLA